MKAALPSGLKLSSESRLAIHPDYSGEMDGIEEEEMHVLEALQHNTFLTLDDMAKLVRKTHVHGIVRSLVHKQMIVQYEEVQQKFKPRKEVIYKLGGWLEDKQKLE